VNGRRNRMRMHPLMWAAALAVALVFQAACNNTQIGQLTSNPGKYQGRTVNVAGQVTTAFGLLGEGAYQIEDGTGSIWVISEGFGVPGKGLRVQVTGAYESGATIGSRSVGNAIRETQPYKTLH
jgi:GW (Gly-Tryp) dipeptide domain